jgi:hypothetical protein
MLNCLLNVYLWVLLLLTASHGFRLSLLFLRCVFSSHETLREKGVNLLRLRLYTLSMAADKLGSFFHRLG